MNKETSDMLEVRITEEMKTRAKDKARKLQGAYGDHGTHRIDSTRRRMTGFAAEEAIKQAYPILTPSLDVSVDFRLGKYTFDVKSQGCNKPPQGNYSATLYEEQRLRAATYYIFCRTKNDLSTVWICGAISKHRFFDLALLKEKGTSAGNFIYDNTRYELSYDQLTDVNVVLDALLKRRKKNG